MALWGGVDSSVGMVVDVDSRAGMVADIGNGNRSSIWDRPVIIAVQRCFFKLFLR